MKNLKATMKLLWPHVVVLLLLVAGIVVSLVSFISIRSQMEALYDEAFIKDNAAEMINESIEDMQTSVFCAILSDSQDVIDKAINDARNSMKMIEEQAPLIQLNDLENNHSIRLSECLSEFASKQKHVLSLLAQKKNAEAAAYMESSNIPVIQETQKELAQLIQLADVKEIELMASLQRTQRTACILLIILGVTGVLFSVGVGIYFLRLYMKGKENLSSPLQRT